MTNSPTQGIKEILGVDDTVRDAHGAAGMDKVNALLSLIDETVKEVIGKQEEIPEGNTWTTENYVGRNDLRSEQLDKWERMKETAYE